MSIKNYPIICPSCHGVGIIPNPSGMTSSATTINCPACNGSKTVMVSEVSDE